jgi:hypothetical protein
MKPRFMIAFLLLSRFMLAQVPSGSFICFNYDAAGNRTLATTCSADIGLQSSPQAPITPTALEPGEILVYPNPSTGIFIVRTDAFTPDTDAVIFDAGARVVFQGTLGDGMFDLSAQGTGTYLLRLTHNGKRPRTVKLELIKD